MKAAAIHHGIECRKLAVGMAGVAHDDVARPRRAQGGLQLLCIGLVYVEVREPREALVGGQPAPLGAGSETPRQGGDRHGFALPATAGGDRLAAVGWIAQQRLRAWIAPAYHVEQTAPDANSSAESRRPRGASPGRRA